jgi:YHS domain-containing protein
MSQVEDPVCGMMIDPAQAAGSSRWNGTTYYFCSTACKEKFDAEPDEYLSGRNHKAMGSAEPRFTKSGPVVAPKFGSATSGGAEYEPGPGDKRAG